MTKFIGISLKSKAPHFFLALFLLEGVWGCTPCSTFNPLLLALGKPQWGQFDIIKFIAHRLTLSDSSVNNIVSIMTNQPIFFLTSHQFLLQN